MAETTSLSAGLLNEKVTAQKMDILWQFLILTKKNLLLRKRHFIISGLELVIPILVSLSFFVMQSPSNGETYTNPAKNYSAMQLTDIQDPGAISSVQYLFECDNKPCIIAYAPINHKTTKIMKALQKILICKSCYQFQTVAIAGFKTEKEMMNNYTATSLQSLNMRYETMMSVIFHKYDKTHFKYTIRASSPNTQPAQFYEDAASSDFGGYSAFLVVQNMLDRIYMNLISTDAQKQELSKIKVSIQQFPSPAYAPRSQLMFYPVFITALIVTMLTIFIPSFIVRIVQEKNSGMRELLRTMGLNNFVNYCAWFLHGFIVMLFVSTIILLLLSCAHLPRSEPFLDISDKLIVWLFLITYSISLLFFCIFISVFFNRGVFAVIFSIIITQAITYGPMFGMDSFMDSYTFNSIGFGSKMISCFLPNAALYWGFRIITQFEIRGIGMHWSNLYESTVQNDSFSLGNVMLMMVGSWFFYAVLIWYFDMVWPWQTGVPRPFYFFLTKSYWFGDNSYSSEITFENGQKNTKYHEEIPMGQQVGIDIRNLRKNFKAGFGTKTAVDGVDLQIYEGQITALLGHNGAGKTTTISMITGMYSPTDGTIFVNGHDVRKNLSLARKCMGYCPQTSIFIPELTVMEHFELIATLKGYPRSSIVSEVNNIIRILNLTDKTNVAASTLSGGMKRKLSLGMAMVGQTKVLLLDEPTSGLDPEARREVWNILQSIRNDRTILLTTHYMEEADALGDRIAIMSDGNIFCSGSSLFLKAEFGAGYHLRMITKDSCDINAVLNFVNQYVSAEIERNSGQELSILITSENTEQFPTLFDNFEKAMVDLKIENFGLSVTNMEDVFLKVGEIALDNKSEEVEKHNERSGKQLRRTTSLDRAVLKSYKEVTGLNLLVQQFIGLICKRFHHNKRQLSSFILQIIIPAVVVGFMILIINIIININVPNLDLNLKDIYKNTKTLVHENLPNTFEIYKTLLADQNSDIIQTSNVQKSIIKAGKKDLNNYKYNYVIGAGIESTIGGTMLNAYSNAFTTHSAPISLNLIDNTKCQMIHPDVKIDVTSHPYPLEHMSFNMNSFFITMIATIFLPIATAFLTSACVLFLVTERSSKSKHLQLMTGVHPCLFWLAHFLWDFVICFSISLIMFTILAAGTVLGKSPDTTFALFVIILLYIWSAIPFVYINSFLFKRPAFGFAFNLAINMISGIVIGITSLMTNIMGRNNPIKVKLTTAMHIFQLFPSSSFTKGVSNMIFKASSEASCLTIRKQCDHIGKDTNIYDVCCTGKHEYHPFGWSDIECGGDMLALFITGVIYIIILMIIESPLPNCVASLIKKHMCRSEIIATMPHNVDDDVAEEQNAVNNIVDQTAYLNQSCQHSLILLNLRKQFKNVLAVDTVSFMVPKEKCFGLLGINGAGKTTTFSMLTGDLQLTSGNAFIGQYNVLTNLKKFQKQIGYCPQFDALLELLTGEELLYLFARLRGVPRSKIASLVYSLVKLVNLEEYAKKKSAVYSGGNKRKLSIAAAVVGLPSLIFLDEPTSGIDPVSRRQIWKLLTNIKMSGISVILSSHSMEECEALCDKLTIMVKGRLQCIGSVTHLKSKFGQGYTIFTKVKLHRDGSDDLRFRNLTDRICKEILGTELQSQNLGLVTFHVKNVKETWSHMFTVLEKIKAELDLEDYAITATTLEEVFLSFARANLAQTSASPSAVSVIQFPLANDSTPPPCSSHNSAVYPWASHSAMEVIA